MLSGPEQARLLKELEESFTEGNTLDESLHEEGLASQQCFQSHTISLIDTVKSMDNSFMEAGPELLSLDIRDVTLEIVGQIDRAIEGIGKEQNIAYKPSVLGKGFNINPEVNREACTSTV